MNKETRAYVLFSNINFLFSGAYRPDAALRRRILPSARLITSVYAAEEARRNLLSTPVQRRELEELLGSVEIVLTVASTGHPLFSALELPDKDRPMLLAAISAGATRLLSGDFRHFGPYYGERIGGFSFCRWEITSLREPNSPTLNVSTAGVVPIRRRVPRRTRLPYEFGVSLGSGG